MRLRSTGSSSADETYTVLATEYILLNDVASWSHHMDMSYAPSSQGTQITATLSGKLSSQQYGAATISESLSLNLGQTNYDENEQVIIDYEDGGRTTGIDIVHGHFGSQNEFIPDSQTCILNDETVDCDALHAMFGGSTTKKVVEGLSTQMFFEY